MIQNTKTIKFFDGISVLLTLYTPLSYFYVESSFLLCLKRICTTADILEICKVVHSQGRFTYDDLVLKTFLSSLWTVLSPYSYSDQTSKSKIKFVHVDCRIQQKHTKKAHLGLLNLASD